MSYRLRFKPKPNKVSDVYDGECYKSMCTTPVTMNRHSLPHNFFSDHHDIALGLATDGFAPFKKRQVTAWPKLLVSYNLPPSLCFCRKYLICVGCIPGPNKPRDIDLFSWILIMELLRLAARVKAYDGSGSGQQFMLHAYLILCTRDMPAVAMLMRMLGHNAILACRMCNIHGVQNPSKPNATTHYPALNCQRHPTKPSPAVYNAADLPIQTHTEFMAQAQDIQLASGPTEHKRLASNYGIKGVSIVSFLGLMSFPMSFLFGSMHLFFKNVIPNMVDLWMHRFNTTLPNYDDFIIMPGAWKAIAQAGVESGWTILSAFGARVPDILNKRWKFTAETWLFWALFLAPTLLCGCFQKPKYYDLFMDLVCLIKQCLAFTITVQDLNEMELGFIKWVKDYKQYTDLHLPMSSTDIVSSRPFSTGSLPQCDPRTPPCCSNHSPAWSNVGLLGMVHGAVLRPSG
jgi:hypothetical protein